MSRARNFSILLPAVLLVAFAGDASRAAYPRREPSTSIRVPARTKTPPPDLRLDARATRPPTAERANVPPKEKRLVELDRMARIEARRTAREIFATSGRREYYRVGFFEGMRAALVGAPDARAFAEGSWLGSNDSDARYDGALAGESAARALAYDRAREQVAEQFHDLSAVPRFLPDDQEPVSTASGFRLREPSLDEVFADFPIPAFDPIRPRASVLLAGWSHDARRLAHGSDHTEFFDASWMNAGAGFTRWSRENAQSEVYRRFVDSRDGARFRARFEAGFDLALREFYAELGRKAYDNGFGDGWAYGAFAQDELQFRRGHAAGLERAFAESEMSAFHRSYPAIYRDAYRDAFEDWSGNAKPEIVSVRLIDAGGDEVFEPGEELFAEYELINYGGRGEELRVRLDGDVLALSARDTVFVPARAGVRSETAVPARIDGAVPSRTRTELRLSVADQVRSAPLRVAYPLQLDRSAVRVDRDDLAGEAQVVVRVRNESVQPIEGSVALAVSSWPGYRDTRPLGRLAGRDATDLVFTLSGLEPLDLMAGEVSFEIDVLDREVLQDELTRDLPDTVRDLANRDLVDYLLFLARDSAAPAGTIARARGLMLERLREDWKAAVKGSGNPYKKDLKSPGRRTALGDLAESCAVDGGRIENPAVLAGFGLEVRELVKDLPGPHPLLRKWARRLTDRLP